MNIDAAFDRTRKPGMGQAEQLFARHDTTRILAECQKDVELGRRHGDVHPVRIDQLPEDGIDLPTGKSHRRWLLGFVRPIGCASEEALYARHEFPRMKGLGNVVVRAKLDADDAVDFIAEGREHDNGHGRRGPQPAADTEPVLSRQHGVEHDQVKSLLPERGVHVGGGADRNSLKAIFRQHLDHHCRNLLVVLDEEDARHRLWRDEMLSGHGSSLQYA